jgi:Sulfotransferase domain
LASNDVGFRVDIDSRIIMKNKYLKKLTNALFPKTKNKIFCIGQNKTGTTSLQATFQQLGYKVGNQREAELLWREYWQADFDSITKYCKTAEVFQDVPFSYPNTYKYLDKVFPNSKFILSIRDNPEQWYKSITGFHSKLFGSGKVPTVDDLKNAEYVCKGWMWENMSKLYGLSENDNPYDEQKLKAHYVKYNQEIQEYFSSRKEDLLVINLSEQGAYQKFCDFIDVKSDKKDFPWENKTSEI